MEEERRSVVDARFQLQQPVDDNYAFIVRPGEESPMRPVEEDE